MNEQELQYSYGLSDESLNRVKKSFMKFLRNLLDKNKTNLELDIETYTVQKDLKAYFEITWEEACSELLAHPQEYCLMDEPLPGSKVKNLAWALRTIIKEQLEMTLRLEQKELQYKRLQKLDLSRRFDLQEKQLRPGLRLNLESKKHPNPLKPTATIITGSLLFISLFFAQALTHNYHHFGSKLILPTNPKNFEQK